MIKKNSIFLLLVFMTEWAFGIAFLLLYVTFSMLMFGAGANSFAETLINEIIAWSLVILIPVTYNIRLILKSRDNSYMNGLIVVSLIYSMAVVSVIWIIGR